jgi:hypothetical protein
MYMYMQELSQPFYIHDAKKASFPCDNLHVNVNLVFREIQAFIYDATVLDYYVGKDPKCKLRTVGNWYAMTGYGIAFPPIEGNPWIEKINRVIFQLQENGEVIDGWMDGWMDAWMDGCMHGWMDACMDGWTYGWMDR